MQSAISGQPAQSFALPSSGQQGMSADIACVSLDIACVLLDIACLSVSIACMSAAMAGCGLANDGAANGKDNSPAVTVSAIINLNSRRRVMASCLMPDGHRQMGVVDAPGKSI